MAISDDFTLDYGTKTITHTSGTTVYTVLALYSWLMDLFDDSSQMDDDVPMSAQTPTSFSLINNWTIPDASMEYLKGGALTDTSDDTVWANVYTIGSDGVISNITLYVEQNGAVLFTASTPGHIDKLVKVKDAGSLIASGVITVHAREWGYTFDWYQMDLSAGGRQPAPIAVAADANNTTAISTVEAYNIGLTFGAYAEDVNGDSSTENYNVELDLNSTYTVANAYEFMKALTCRGKTSTVNGVQGQIYKIASAGYDELKGAGPLASFAGGKLFSARGLFLKLAERPATEANKYELIDSDGNTGISEPTSITVQVTSLDASDQVLVALAAAGALVTDQYTCAASGNSLGASTVTLAVTPNADTPASGTLRINRKRYQYDSYTGTVFTLNTTAHPSGLEEDCNSADVFIPWLDKVSGGSIASVGVAYAADRDVLVRVRQSGILPFESPGSISSTGLSVAAIRTTDSIVS